MCGLTACVDRRRTSQTPACGCDSKGKVYFRRALSCVCNKSNRTKTKKHLRASIFLSKNRYEREVIWLATTYPDVASQWHPTKNGNKTPRDYTAGSAEKVYWLCSNCGYDWPAIIYSRCSKKACGCPCCAGRVVVPGINDLATKNPLVAAEWHPTKNGSLTPRIVTPGSQKKVWWLCSKCGNEWLAVISSRSSGYGCDKCGRENAGKSRRKTSVKQKGSLAETNPLLAAQWHPTKNGDNRPEDYTAGSSYDA